MPNLDYERMIKLGEWLEKLLNPNAKSWDYHNLAKEFIDLYNMAFELSSNDITIKALALIKDNNSQTENRYIKYLKEIDDFLRQEIYFILDPPNDTVGKLELLYQRANDEGKKILTLLNENINTDTLNEYFFEYDFIEYSLKRIAKIIEISSLIKTTFHLLSENSKPWFYSLFEIFQNDKYLVDNYNKRSLLDAYNGLVEELIINENGAIKQKTFQKKYRHSFPALEHPSVFPWDVAASRIFFDFLFLGGQEYFLFCEYCGKFTVIQRKGRKKFCSDICRTAYRNNNLAKL